MAGETWAILGSSGEMEFYHDPYAGVTQEMAEEAIRFEEEIVKRREMVEQGFLEMAFLLDEFDRKEYYRARGYASMKEWSEDPGVEIGHRVALDLLRIVREAVPVLAEDDNLEPAIDAISRAKISKTRAMLPLLSLGMHDEFRDLISRAPDMTLRDVNREVRILKHGGDPNGDLMPAVFKAFVRRGDKTSRYKITVMDGQVVQDVGTLLIPNEYTARFDERFGRFIEYEFEESAA